MPRSVMPVLVTIAMSIWMVGTAAWGHEGEHPGGGGASPGHGDHAAEPEQDQEVAQGNFFPMGDTDTGDSVFGYAKVVRSQGGTDAFVHLSGLAPDTTYPTHLHEGTCADHGPHYRHDPQGGEGPPNELWPSSDPDDPRAGVTSDDEGVATGEGHAHWKARDEARSVMVHDQDTGHMVACADLS